MTRKDIIALPNPHLRLKSERVRVITPTIEELITNMQAATLDWEDSRPHELGVALAAVQVDQLKRVIIVRNDFDNKEDRSFVALIDPEIIKLEGTTAHDHEGCLSVPDIYGLVPRASKVRVRAIDEKGREVRMKAQGFLARVLQHEIDHMNGTLFIDHIKDQDVFFELTPEGALKKVSHASIAKNRLLW